MTLPPVPARLAASRAAAALFLVGCGLFPERVSLSDPRVVPMLKAMEQVDRGSLGFTPITPGASARLESGRSAYDAMLHIDGATSRTVAFKKTDSGYVWIHEQETHRGPREHTTPDGTFKESVTITYEKSPVSGVPLNRTHVLYLGDDARLRGRIDLELADVAPVLAEWRQARDRADAAAR